MNPTHGKPYPPPRSDAAFWERYAAYMESPEWQAKRRQVLGRAHFVCEGCGLRPAEHVHHLSYAHFGAEFLWELAAVCVECHSRIHRRFLGAKLQLATR